jgi:hypothetical protein
MHGERGKFVVLVGISEGNIPFEQSRHGWKIILK